RYVFDQITRLPPGFTSLKTSSGDALASLNDEAFFLLLDPKPQNSTGSKEVAELFSTTLSKGFELTPQEVKKAIGVLDCDMYVLSTNYELKIAACHEDDVVNDNRIVWVPVRQNASAI